VRGFCFITTGMDERPRSYRPPGHQKISFCCNQIANAECGLSSATVCVFVFQAVSTLQQIGISDAATINYRSKLAFVAQIGKPALTVEGLLPRNATSAIIAVTLTGESGLSLRGMPTLFALSLQLLCERHW